MSLPWKNLRDHEKVELVEALRDGECIQDRPNGAAEWADFSEVERPAWDPEVHYRIKPRDWWILPLEPPSISETPKPAPWVQVREVNP